MTIVDKTNQILDDVNLPEGTEKYLVLTYKDGKRIKEITHPQLVYMSQQITKEVFGHSKGRYSIISTQTSYDLMHSDEKFKEFAKKELRWFHCRETLLQSGLLISDPKVRDIGGELRYILEAQVVASEGKLKPLKSDKAIEIRIDVNDAIGTLVEAGVMKEPMQKVNRSGVSFDSNGLSSLWSHWDALGECFCAGAYFPSERSPLGVAVLEKLPSEQEKIDIKILELESSIKEISYRVDEIKGKAGCN